MNLCSKEKMKDFLKLDALSREEGDALLERHKLGGLFPDYNPTPFKKYWVKNTKAIEFVSELSQRSDLKGCLLKGSHLIAEYYEHIGERFMGDIDILISPENLCEWEAYLLNDGFSEIKEIKWEANEFKKVYGKEINGIEIVIELHTRLFFQERGEVDWECCNEPFRNFSYLKVEDLVIHLSGHLAYQHSFQSLYWLFDLTLIFSKEKIDWEVVYEKSSKAGVRRSISFVQMALEKYLNGEAFNQGFYDRFLFNSLVTRSFLIEPYDHKIRLFLFKAFVKDSLIDSLGYFYGWLKARLS